MRVVDYLHEPGSPAVSGRLRFSITAARCEEQFRVMVLDASGRVRHRIRVSSEGSRTPVRLTGFPRGEVFLVCAFADDELVWSAPVLAG
jgi:hypothetical protein